MRARPSSSSLLAMGKSSPIPSADTRSLATPRLTNASRTACARCSDNNKFASPEEKLLYFYNLLNDYAPEELEFMNNEDIAELISVSEHLLNNIQIRLNNENS